MGGSVARAVNILKDAVDLSLSQSSGGLIKTAANDKFNKEIQNAGEMLDGTQQRQAADAEIAARKKEEQDRDAAQLLYDQQAEHEKKQAAARARQRSLGGAGFGRNSTILTSPLGSASNQTAADQSAKTLLGS